MRSNIDAESGKKLIFAQTSLNNGTVTDVRHAVDELDNVKKHCKSKHIRPPANFRRNTQCSCILSRIVYRCGFFGRVKSSYVAYQSRTTENEIQLRMLVNDLSK